MSFLNQCSISLLCKNTPLRLPQNDPFNKISFVRKPCGFVSNCWTYITNPHGSLPNYIFFCTNSEICLVILKKKKLLFVFSSLWIKQEIYFSFLQNFGLGCIEYLTSFLVEETKFQNKKTHCMVLFIDDHYSSDKNKNIE